MPNFLSEKLWGDRMRYGLHPVREDPCWIEWQGMQTEFYLENQTKGIGAVVNDSGYEIMSSLDLENKTVLEFGPGDLRHYKFWNGHPKEYFIADVHEGMMNASKEVFEREKIPYQSYLIRRNEDLPIKQHSIDVLVSFYSLEHLHPLIDYLMSIKRYLKPNGIIVGAIPTEGGLLWGLGRFFTTRRWLKRNTTINYDKLICWEHPNFADHIIRSLDQNFQRMDLKAWPIPFLASIDCNLTLRFCYKNTK